MNQKEINLGKGGVIGEPWFPINKKVVKVKRYIKNKKLNYKKESI